LVDKCVFGDRKIYNIPLIPQDLNLMDNDIVVTRGAKIFNRRHGLRDMHIGKTDDMLCLGYMLESLRDTMALIVRICAH